jgi:hypothetical protein
LGEWQHAPSCVDGLLTVDCNPDEPWMNERIESQKKKFVPTMTLPWSHILQAPLTYPGIPFALSSSSRLAYRYQLLLRGTSLSSPTQRAPPAQSLLDYFICSHAGSSLVTNQSTARWKIYDPDCRRNSTYCFSLHSTECMMPTLLSIILVVSVILNGKGINV